MRVRVCVRVRVCDWVRVGVDASVLTHGGARVDTRLGRLESHHLVGGVINR